MSTMREEFERWAKESGYCVQTLDRFNAYPPGTYSDSRTHAAWNAWQAATQASPAPVPDEQADQCTGDVWIKHDDDLRYVKRVLEAGRAMTDADRDAALAIVHGLRTTARTYGAAAEKREPLTPLQLHDEHHAHGMEHKMGTTFHQFRVIWQAAEKRHGIGTQPSTGDTE